MKNPPLVLNMVIRRSWRPRRRRTVMHKIVFRLYRPVTKKNGEWMLKKCRDVHQVRYKPRWIKGHNGKWHLKSEDEFQREMHHWGEQECERQGWSFEPNAYHQKPLWTMSESYQVLLELEQLAQRNEQ